MDVSAGRAREQPFGDRRRVGAFGSADELLALSLTQGAPDAPAADALPWAVPRLGKPRRFTNQLKNNAYLSRLRGTRPSAPQWARRCLTAYLKNSCRINRALS